MASREVSLFIALVTFLGVFGVLTATAPHELIQTNSSQRQINVPNYFEAEDVTAYSDTVTINASQCDWVVDTAWANFKVGGYDCQLRWLKEAPYRIFFTRLEYWWIFITGSEDCKWYYEGSPIYKEPVEGSYCVYVDDIEQYFEDGSAKFQVECSRFRMAIAIAYNSSKYSSFKDAFLAKEWFAFIGVTWDQINTSINIWELIGKLLFFQMPDLPPVLNAVIAIPIWAAITILVFILVLKVIPFVGGG